MRCASFLVALLCIFKCIGLVSAICTVSNHQGGSGNRLQCSNATLQTINNQTTDVSGIMIFNSDLRYIQERMFIRYARYLQSLNMHNCHINDIHSDAFDGLASLKKLALPNNNLTRVKEEWFNDLVYLEQLDLSFNHISMIESSIFGKMPLLKRLDIRENRFTCIDPSPLPGGIDKLYFNGNPLTFKSRGTLTLWLRDHGVAYKIESIEKEAWLDKLLWLCAIGDASVAESEELIKECVILNAFNQLRTGLSTAESYPLVTNCAVQRNLLTSCIVTETQRQQSLTNGNVIKKLLLYIGQAKSV
ncbi:chaoptin-like [Ceratina calcarata]|uniref:Chaoptin-like n=1 Tax=Ceratina calcarata TaxID=156304 RepID=A0AAJ7N525_9HYME|nr:chaoptin-like [Ceratina calcarata]